MDEGGPGAGGEHGLHQADGATDVGAQGDVEGAVEGHLGGGVDDDVHVRERAQSRVLEPEPGPSQVAAEGAQPGGERRLPSLPEPLPQRGEGA